MKNKKITGDQLTSHGYGQLFTATGNIFTCLCNDGSKDDDTLSLYFSFKI